MGSLSQFAANMRRKANNLEPAVAKALADLAISVVSDVAPNTPYKTGQAQSNWIVSIGQMNPFYKANADHNGGWQESVSEAIQALANYKGDSDIHITNNVSYIAELNRGSSRQAPALFVQAAVLRAQYKFKGIRIKI